MQPAAKNSRIQQQRSPTLRCQKQQSPTLSCQKQWSPTLSCQKQRWPTFSCQKQRSPTLSWPKRRASKVLWGDVFRMYRWNFSPSILDCSENSCTTKSRLYHPMISNRVWEFFLGKQLLGSSAGSPSDVLTSSAIFLSLILYTLPLSDSYWSPFLSEISRRPSFSTWSTKALHSSPDFEHLTIFRLWISLRCASLSEFSIVRLCLKLVIAPHLWYRC